MKQNKITIIVIVFFVVLISISLSLFIASVLYNLNSGNFNEIYKLSLNETVFKNSCIGFIPITLLLIIFYLLRDTRYKIKNIKITDNISIPKPFKNSSQYGSARFYSKNELRKHFKRADIYSDLTNPHNSLIKSAGVIIDYTKYRKKERIYYVDENIHTVCLGGSRSGKSRHFCLQLLTLMILAGENFLANDIKEELLLSCCDLLKYHGYKTIILNFNNLNKSNHYNFLDIVIKYIDIDMQKAETYVFDIATSFASSDGYSKGEKIWEDGQISVIATAIFCVILENKNHRELQNMGNVYHFISTMCIPKDFEEEPIIQYVDSLSDDSIIKRTFSVARLANSKTRLSFYTSALASLRIFASEGISKMTSKSDFNIEKMDKTAIFIVSSAEKDTYSKIISLMIHQIYSLLGEIADVNGGLLNKRFNFVLDEFANLGKILNFAQILSVAGGRNIRFYLFLQSFSQLNTNYGRDIAHTILDNCKLWIYLNSNSVETLTEIQNKLGTYTTASISNSSNSKSDSTSLNLLARNLLKVDELARLERPFVLTIYNGYPIISKIPDLSKWNFNNFLGLGDIEHNIQIRKFREEHLPIPNVGNFKYWDTSILNKGGKECEENI